MSPFAILRNIYIKSNLTHTKLVVKQLLSSINMVDSMMAEVSVNAEQLKQAAWQASQLLKALANEYRLLILCNLMDGEKQVAELNELIELSQSSLSQHLARLREEGLVQTRRKSQMIFYSLAGTEVKQIISVLHGIYCKPAEQTQKTRRAAH